jgi:YesN/AraC family two-component response regulator
MSKEVQRKIFEPFFQGDVPKDMLNQGTGIGLSITNEFVKLHGGSIEVDSEPGKGSVFTILLPCVPIFNAVGGGQVIAEADSSKTAGLVNPEQQVENFEKLTILIVEDNDDFRAYLKDNLKSQYKVVEAGNGKEGWQKALSTHPKVIVSDISMPVMDGITLCRKLKSDKRTSHIPIILLTALTGNTNQLNGLRTGASDYLTKPFSFEILDLKIKNLLELNLSLKETYTKQLKLNSAEVKFQSEDEQLLIKISQYIESNIDSTDLSVADLSKHVFMSRGSLYSKIVSLTGETPVEYIRSLKLNKAAALLENSDMKIAEIGYAVGFATPNYFTRAFKAKYNISPSEYLKLKRNNSRNSPSGSRQPDQGSSY